MRHGGVAWLGQLRAGAPRPGVRVELLDGIDCGLVAYSADGVHVPTEFRGGEVGSRRRQRRDRVPCAVSRHRTGLDGVENVREGGVKAADGENVSGHGCDVQAEAWVCQRRSCRPPAGQTGETGARVDIGSAGGLACRIRLHRSADRPWDGDAHRCELDEQPDRPSPSIPASGLCRPLSGHASPPAGGSGGLRTFS